jgi:hypothetical protein
MIAPGNGIGRPFWNSNLSVWAGRKWGTDTFFALPRCIDGIQLAVKRKWLSVPIFGAPHVCRARLAALESALDAVRLIRILNPLH